VSQRKEEVGKGVERLQQRLRGIETKVERCKVQMREPLAGGLGPEERQKLLGLQVQPLNHFYNMRAPHTAPIGESHHTYWSVLWRGAAWFPESRVAAYSSRIMYNCLFFAPVAMVCFCMNV
jgi:hypothetical protein